MANIHIIASDLRRYGFANVGKHRITGSKTKGFSLWLVEAHGCRKWVATYSTLEALLEAL